MMKAMRLMEIGELRTMEVERPKPKGKELLVKIGACGVCGSDIPRAFQIGAGAPLPLTIGHEFSGTITEVGERADPTLVGKRGAFFPLIPCMECEACRIGHYAECGHYNYMGSRCDGGFAEYCLVPSAWNFVECHNGTTDFETLAMTEPACVAQHAVRRSGLTAGQSLIIFGAGPIGIMAARWAEQFGAEKILLVDVTDEKVEFAQKRGLMAVNGMTHKVFDYFRERNDGKLADAVIEGSGTGAAFSDSADCVRAFGTIVMMGNPSADVTIRRNQYSTLLRKEVTIKGIWNSYYADLPLNEWRYTVSQMDRGGFHAEDLITHRADLARMPELMRDIYEKKISICKAMYCADREGEA